MSRDYQDAIERYMDEGLRRYAAEREAAADAIGWRPKRPIPFWLNSRDPAYPFDDEPETEEL